MSVAFASVKRHHRSSNELSPSYLDKKALYREIGYDIDNLIRQNPGYQNTCAARMSIALVKSGVSIRGRLPIKTGPYKGRSVEPGAKLLADELSRVLGKPEILSPSYAPSKLHGKKGIVFFWKISGYGGGHIDLIETADSIQVCNSACYFSSKEVWFWSLN